MALPFAACRAADPVAPPSRTREVVSVVDAIATRDGAGVRLRRSIGGPSLSMLDPFLLLDEMHSDRPEDYEAGFPTHPHRGFETVTYVIDGAVEHKDSLGNHGHLGPGSVQWMTAGHGIVHSEMPKQRDGRIWAFQLWVNLPRARKLVAPRYQDLAPERAIDLEVEDARVKLLAGAMRDRVGPVEGIVTAPQLADVTVIARGRFSMEIPSSHNAFAYVIDGAAKLGDDGARVAKNQIAVFGPGDRLRATSDDGARFLVASARPIGEPVARSGPFVMNNEEELRQAWDDYRSGALTRM